MISRFFYAMAFVAAFVSCGGNVEVRVCDAGSGGTGGQVVDAGFDAPSDAAQAEDAPADGPPPLPFCGDGVTCTDVKGVKCPNGTSCGPNATCFDGQCSMPSASAVVSAPCGPCGGWWDWGHRMAVCPSPSEGLLDDLLACINSTCASSCGAWISGYNACASSGDTSCSWPDDPSCDVCIAKPNADGGCRAETTACGYDQTGCVLCGDWLGGGDPQWLCPYASISAAIDVEACACAEKSCSASCDEWGALDVTSVDGQCATDVQTDCATEYNACTADANLFLRAPRQNIGAARRMTDALRDRGVASE